MYKGFEKKINYYFKNKDLLLQSLTHSSYANENKLKSNNERLEFLGDAVLELTISEYLYNKFPDKSEGELTKYRANLVCEPSLAKLARLINLGEVLKLGKGENATGGRNRDSLLADAFEALLGSIFLDGDFDGVRTFIINIFFSSSDIDDGDMIETDSKTILQERLQRTSTEPIVYHVISESGPDHEKEFITQVFHKSKMLGEGKGKNKKESEQDAASNALRAFS